MDADSQPSQESHSLSASLPSATDPALLSSLSTTSSSATSSAPAAPSSSSAAASSPATASFSAPPPLPSLSPQSAASSSPPSLRPPSSGNQFKWSIGSVLLALAAAVFVAILGIGLVSGFGGDHSKGDGWERQNAAVYLDLTDRLPPEPCLPVSREHIVNGSYETQSGKSISLLGLRTSIIHHMETAGYKGLCVSNLAGTLPLCYCVMDWGTPKKRMHVDMFNLRIASPSENNVLFSDELSPFCAKPVWRYRWWKIYGYFEDRDGDEFPFYFVEEKALVVQQMADTLLANATCQDTNQEVMQHRQQHTNNGAVPPPSKTQQLLEEAATARRKQIGA